MKTALNRWLIAGVGMTVALGVCSAASAQNAAPTRERESYDPETGRNLRNFPPHRTVDARHIKLDLRIADMNVRSMDVTETITLAPIAGPTGAFTLHGAHLDIQSASIPDRAVRFTANAADETVEFTVEPPLGRDQVVDMVVQYRVVDAPEGLMWTVQSPAHPGRVAQVYTQGQSEMNRYWFLGHDFPNARLTSEIIATVPRGFEVISNGRLVSRSSETEGKVRDGAAKFETFHWRQDKPHAMYLVSMIVGKFDTADVGSRALPMPVYVPKGQGDRIRKTFSRTPKMAALIGRLVDEPYPWPQYAQTCVENFAFGGMENTGATTLFGSAALDDTALLDDDQDALIVHELAHQWFGDLLTCKSWEHVWLNEGFATYFEKVWAQYRGSEIPSRGTGSAGITPNADEYTASLWGELNTLIENDEPDAPYQPAMASKVYRHPDDAFDRKADAYFKGSFVLHMLRVRLGDDIFWRGVGEYVNRFKGKPVETAQFRRALEDASGESLQRFFDQWVRRPGVPRVETTIVWNEASKTLALGVEQKQKIDGDNPAFALDIPIWVRCKGENEGRVTHIAFDERVAATHMTLPSEPEMVVIDPGLSVLADFRIVQPIERFARQIEAAPTLAGRLHAARTLGFIAGSDSERAASTLSATAASAKAHRAVRVEALKSLARLANAPDSRVPRAALLGMVGMSCDDPQVLKALIQQTAAGLEKAPETERTAAAELIAGQYRKSRSYIARAAAINALGTLKANDHRSDIIGALGVDSQHDQIRCAAVEALGMLGGDDALARVLAATSEGNSSNLREAAAKALGEFDANRVVPALTAILNDREPKAAAAAETLAKLGGPDAEAAIVNARDAARGRAWRGVLENALRELKNDQ